MTFASSNRKPNRRIGEKSNVDNTAVLAPGPIQKYAPKVLVSIQLGKAIPDSAHDRFLMSDTVLKLKV